MINHRPLSMSTCKDYKKSLGRAQETGGIGILMAMSSLRTMSKLNHIIGKKQVNQLGVVLVCKGSKYCHISDRSVNLL